MNARIEFQTILGPDGRPAFAVVPYAEFMKLYAREEGTIPNEVMARVVMDGLTPLRAWREHLGLTQAGVAERLGVSQSALAQLEAPGAKPRKSTLRRIAAALGLSLEQVAW